MIAETLEMIPIAEGVETNEQCRVIEAAGCALAQGFLFAKPIAGVDLASHLTQSR
jgi:EAL domain-containing protein (putative c-di-GMP-specific phosphodiesterase class I)